MTGFGLIIGFPRSGTTLLRRILDAHPQVSCPPETWLTTAAARFVQDVEAVGPPIGVRTGLGCLGIDEAEILADLRDLVARYHARLAGDKPIRVEKSGFDIFYLSELDALFRGRARLICLVRHPLDVVASNLDLAARLGRFMPELDPFLARHPAPVTALAAAWADRTAAQLDLARGWGDAACLLRYEDLVADPGAALAPALDLLGAARPDAAQLARMLEAEPRAGLGDWKVHATALTSAPVGRWKATLSRGMLRDAQPLLAPLATQLGYDLPPPVAAVSRAQAIRQLALSGRVARARRDAATGERDGG